MHPIQLNSTSWVELSRIGRSELHLLLLIIVLPVWNAILQFLVVGCRNFGTYLESACHLRHFHVSWWLVNWYLACWNKFNQIVFTRTLNINNFIKHNFTYVIQKQLLALSYPIMNNAYLSFILLNEYCFVLYCIVLEGNAYFLRRQRLIS